MRIAVISVHGCPCIQPGGTDAGGMNVYVDETSQRLARRGNSVHVYSRWHPDYERGQQVARDYELIHVRAGTQCLAKDMLPEILPEFAQSVSDHAKAHALKFDLIASHYWLSGIVGADLAHAWQVPHVTSFHTLASIKRHVKPDEEEPPIRFTSERRVAQDADLIVVWTAGEGDFIQSELGIDVDRVAIVPPGVDTEIFKHSREVRNRREKRRILYVGRLDALKGIDLLIEVFSIVISECVDAELQVVGGGTEDEFRRVLSRIHELRLSTNIKMPGVLAQSELPAVYSEADCIVAPSFHETFGLAVLEAAACGTPAVAADVDGLRSIVLDRQTGFLLQERAPELYAQKIIEILTDNALRDRMSAAARQRATALSWDVAVSNLLDVYRGLASQH